MAKYQTYAEYKDSRVEWLGEIPNSWQVKKLKYLCKVTTGNKDTVNAVEDGKYPFFVRSQTVERINSIGADCEAVLTAGDGVGVGKVYHYYKGKFDFHQRVYMLYDFGAVIGRFVYYYLSSNFYKVALEGNAKSTVDSLRLPQFLNFEFSLPTIKEQDWIVDFLDYETTKIDHLIEKQQQLIELLKEKRQAVISHAVTKGLNPNVPMKDSGVEWLGEVPEHWISSRLKYYTNQIVDGAHFTPTYSESGVPFLRVTDIHNSKIDMDNIKYIPEHEHLDLIQRCKPEKGDLLLSKNGTIGIPKLVDWDWEFSIFVSICLIKFKKNLKAEFAEYFFKSYEIQEQIFGLIKKSTVINLHLDKIENFWFSIPPLDEQIQIVEYLDNKINELNNLISKAESAIQLMQERRTALISAAVTGKIDVRNWQARMVAEADTELSA
ncbi:restriction endonuclease subunit S [Acinetobacter indicus]|uniref:restriction endonuclease subunit S n=1 Tax=Acinetobacter indicus TaxID=756892 RepID=UPI0035BBDF0D